MNPILFSFMDDPLLYHSGIYRYPQALDTRLATKADMARLEGELKLMEGELRLMKWMLGLVIGGISVLILKTFF